MTVHRPGFIASIMAARMFAILNRMSGGRRSIHIITGADDVEMQADGNFLSKDQRYERSHEYVDVMRKELSSETPLDHAGRYYTVKCGFAHVRPDGGAILIFLGGTWQAAIVRGAQVADVFAFPGFGLELASGLARAFITKAARHKRRPTC